MNYLIDNINFDSILCTYGFYAFYSFESLANLQNSNERIKHSNEQIISLHDDIKHFTKRLKEEGNCDIEIWIAERYDQLTIYEHYLNNIINNTDCII